MSDITPTATPASIPAIPDPDFGDLSHDGSPSVQQRTSPGFTKTLQEDLAQKDRELAAAKERIALMERVIKRIPYIPLSDSDLRLRTRRYHALKTLASPPRFLSRNTQDALYERGYGAVWSFCEEPEEKLLAQGMTRREIDEIRKGLSTYGITLGQQIEPF